MKSSLTVAERDLLENLRLAVFGGVGGLASPVGVSAQFVSATRQIYPGSGVTAGLSQNAVGLLAGTGAPVNAVGNDGDIYARKDGGAGTTIYQRRVGVWVGIV